MKIGPKVNFRMGITKIKVPRAKNFKKSSYGAKKWSHSNLAENLHNTAKVCGEFNNNNEKDLSRVKILKNIESKNGGAIIRSLN